MGKGTKGFFVKGPYPLPQTPTPNPLSKGGTGVSPVRVADILVPKLRLGTLDGAKLCFAPYPIFT